MSILDQLGIDGRFVLLSFIGFALLVWVLSKFAFGPMLKMLEQRQTTIQGNLDEAQARRNEMVKLQHEYEDRLSKIEEEARDRVQSAVKEAQAARDEMLARARADADAILARGQSELEQERQKSLIEGRNQIADLAVAAAEKLIKKNLDGQSHASLIDDVIGNLGTGNSMNGGPASSAGRL